MTVERTVIEHYRHGALEEALLAGLKAAGKDLDNLTADDLAAADEFHIGGRQATKDFAAELAPTPGMRLLDIGSGIGGPSRFFARHYGCHVTGIDLSEEYVVVATTLSRVVGLDAQVEYRQASALALPFPDNSFDGVYMLHVGMNISDKARLFREVHRVLARGGLFALYDVMRTGGGLFNYPLPWSSGDETNFIETPAAYRALLSADGFEVVKERERAATAIELFRAVNARAVAGGLPPFGLHLVMGDSAPQKIANTLAALEAGTIAPVEMICRRVEINPHAGNV